MHGLAAQRAQDQEIEGALQDVESGAHGSLPLVSRIDTKIRRLVSAVNTKSYGPAPAYFGVQVGTAENSPPSTMIARATITPNSRLSAPAARRMPRWKRTTRSAA